MFGINGYSVVTAVVSHKTVPTPVLISSWMFKEFACSGQRLWDGDYQQCHWLFSVRFSGKPLKRRWRTFWVFLQVCASVNTNPRKEVSLLLLRYGFLPFALTGIFPIPFSRRPCILFSWWSKSHLSFICWISQEQSAVRNQDSQQFSRCWKIRTDQASKIKSLV